MNVDSVSDVQRERAVRVGFVMRAYREAFVHEDGRRGMSQNELLRRMGEVDFGYSRSYTHATVSRWESGYTRPMPDRLRVFGRAVNLSGSENEDLLAMAGLVVSLQPVPGTGVTTQVDL